MDWVYNIGLYSIPAFALLLGVEIIGDRLERRREEKANFHVGRRRAGFSTRDTLSSLSVYGLLRIVKPLNDLIRLPAIVIAATLAPWTLPATQWWVWVMAIVGADFAYYIEHRMQHRIRLFWAAHSVHHSSEHFNMSTAVRLPWLLPGAMLTSVVYAPLALIGIPAWLVFLSHSIVLLFQYPCTPNSSDDCPVPGNTYSTRPRTTASITAPTTPTWTRTSAESSSFGIAYSGPTPKKPNRFATGSPTTSPPSTRSR